MYFVKIRNSSGNVEVRPLSKSQPLSIGQHPSNDVCIDEPDVERLHCRIAWNKNGYEIAAATSAGVIINGTMLHKWMLSEQDLVYIGGTELRLVYKESPPEEKRGRKRIAPATIADEPLLPDDDSLPLIDSDDGAPRRPLEDTSRAPLEDEPLKPLGAKPAQPSEKQRAKPRREEPPEPLREERVKPVREKAAKPLREKPPKVVREESREEPLKPVRERPAQPVDLSPAIPAGKKPSRPQPPPVDDVPDDDDEGVDIGQSLEFILARDEGADESRLKEILGVDDESDRAADDEPKRDAPQPAEEPKSSPPPEREEEKPEGRRDEDEPVERRAERREHRRRSSEQPPSKLASLREKLGGRSVRPGEQDALRSPFVLTLTLGAVVLFLAAATFWFVIERQAVQQQLASANTEYEQGRYTQAIALFEGFLMKYPRHKDVPEVMLTLGKAQIEKEIMGATPSWKNGLSALQEFIDRHRDDETFADLRDTLAKYAKAIAIGSVETAASIKSRELMEVSSAAALIFERYAPADPPPVEFRQELNGKRESAEQAILKHETLQSALSDIKTALEASRPLDALLARRRLLARYPDLVADTQIAAALAQTLDTTRKLVVREDVGREAETTERTKTSLKPLTLALHTRALSGETSDGQAVFVIANGCCFGIDRVTGEPRWRRAIGLDSPFFPVLVQTSQTSGLLVYDTRFRELVLLERLTGRLIWRQTLDEEALGVPLLHEGQIYQVTKGGHLCGVDLETGKSTVRLTFPQPLHASPVLLSGGTHVAVAGEEAILYSLTLRPLACESASLLGHKAGSLVAPLLSMGSLILVTENNSLQSSVLRVVDAHNPSQGLAEIKSAKVAIEGQVQDPPVLRGNSLFVPASGEQVSAFTVSDDSKETPLTLIGRHSVKTDHPGPVFLNAGPDGQMWMAGSALRRFQLKTNSISLDPNLVAEGMTTQPLQSYGQYLFAGRRRPHSRSVWFVKIDREAQPSMTSLWRVVTGPRILVALTSGESGSVCLSEEGDLFHISAQELTDGGFRTRADGRLQVPDNLAQPLRAAMLEDGQIAVDCGTPTPKLWLLNPQGQVKHEIPVEEPLQIAPVLLAGGVVLPYSQRLEFKAFQPGHAQVERYTAPVEDQTNVPRWTGAVTVDENDMIATNSHGQIVKVQYRKVPVPHLYEAAKTAMGQPVDVPPVAFEDKVLVADASGRLRLLHTSNLEPLAETQLEAPVSGPLCILGKRLLAEVGRSQLVSFAIGSKLNKEWSVPLEGGGLSDRPIESEAGIVFGEKSGRIVLVDPKTGQVVSQVSVEQPIDLGPRTIGTAFFVGSIDGTLYRVEFPSQATQ